MRILLALILLVGLSACSGLGESRLNPFNWFGSGQSETAQEPVADTTDPALRDDRPLVAQVSSLTVSKTSSGAVLTAIGQMPTQGYWGAELVPLNGGVPVRGELTYLFRVSPPEGSPPVSRRSQRISVGVFLGIEELSGIRTIAVRGASNIMRTRR